MNGIQFTLAARYLMGRKLRTLLTTLAIIFGVTILFGMTSLIPTMYRALRQNMLAATGQVDMTVTSVTDGTFDESLAEDVRAIDGIATATGSLRQNVQLPWGEGVTAITVAGLDIESAREVHVYRVQEGRFLEPGDDQMMVITTSLVEQTDLALGDMLTLPAASGTMDFEIVGIIEASGLPGVEEVYVPMEAAQRLVNQPGRINTVDAVFAPGVSREEMEARVSESLGAQYKIGQLEAARAFGANLQVAEIVITMFGIVALIMGGFIIFITFRTIVLERRRDVGMLRAIGASRRTVLGVILAESLLQGVLGTLIGLALGFGLAYGLMALANPLFENVLHMQAAEPVFATSSLILAVVMGVGVTVLGGLFPAISATHVTPLDALRPVLAEIYDRASGRGALVGAILIVLAALGLLSGNFGLVALGFLLFVVGLVLLTPAIVKPIASIFGALLALVFAREGQIAQGNMTRQPSRAAVTATVMMIGLALLVALAGMITSLEAGFMRYLDTSLGVDFVLMPQSLLLGAGNVGASPELAQQIGEAEGVTAVTSIRMSTSLVGETPIQVVGIDPQTYGQISGLDFVEGEPEAVFADLDNGRAVVLNGVYSAQSGIEVGDTLSLVTPEGPQDYHVVGIGNDYLNAKLPTAYISQENLAQDFHQTGDLLIMVELEPNADRAALRSQIGALVEDYPAFTLFNFEELRASQQVIFKQAIGMLYGFGFLLAVPSLIALMNTQVINVMERTREIGMVRAVGATRRQIRRIILAETLLLAATGTAFGILSGVWLSYVFVGGMSAAGFNLPYYFPAGGILLGLAVGLLAGVVASLVPAAQAARLEIVQALRYE